MPKDNLDNQMEGQMTIADLYDPPDRLLAVSNIFARARKDMSLAEQKTFVYALALLDFTKIAPVNYVTLDKKVLANILGIHSDSDHLSMDIYEQIKDISVHSFIEVKKEDKDFCSNGVVISNIDRLRNSIRVNFNPAYMPLFTGLDGNYITLWSTDIFQMTSKRSVQFYEYLRQITDIHAGVNDFALGVKAIKEMFGIPKDGKGSYTRADGHFNRPEFEKRVIDPLCEDLKNCRMIQLIVQPDGKYYEKVKRGNRVDGYRFHWIFTSRPGIATAGEVKELQERVDQDPEVLKIAKDIAKGKKKTKKAAEKTKFNSFEQREYTSEQYKALEEKMSK